MFRSALPLGIAKNVSCLIAFSGGFTACWGTAVAGLINNVAVAIRFTLGLHRVVVSLLKRHILKQTDGGNILLLYGAVALLGLTYYYTLGLWLEQHATGGDG